MNVQTDSNSYPTTGQLERAIAQRVRALYRNLFGHQPSKVDCHLLENKLIISMEDVITPIEKLLTQAESLTLVDQLRVFIDAAIKPKLQELIEEIALVNVVNCLYDTEVDTGCAGAIVILANPPLVRRSKSLSKYR